MASRGFIELLRLADMARARKMVAKAGKNPTGKVLYLRLAGSDWLPLWVKCQRC